MVPMRGRDNHEPIEMGLNVSQFKEQLKDGKSGKFFLTFARGTSRTWGRSSPPREDEEEVGGFIQTATKLASLPVGPKSHGEVLAAAVLFYEKGKLLHEVPFKVQDGKFGDKTLRLTLVVDPAILTLRPRRLTSRPSAPGSATSARGRPPQARDCTPVEDGTGARRRTKEQKMSNRFRGAPLVPLALVVVTGLVLWGSTGAAAPS